MSVARLSQILILPIAFAVRSAISAPPGAAPPGSDPEVHRSEPVHARAHSAITPEERLLATGSRPAYHSGSRLFCSDCHAFGSRPKALDPSADHLVTSGQNSPAAPFSLNSPDLTQLCLDCHDGRPGVPDVAGDDANGLAERSAGLFASADEANPRGHDLARAPRTIADEAACGGCHAGEGPGGVTCVDCHDPHGNGNPRNLRWASSPAATPPLGLFVRPGATGLARYDRANVAYGTTDSDRLREVTSLCLDCHHLFSGRACTDPDRDGIRSRHPSYDSERGDPVTIAQGSALGSTDPGRWLRGSGAGFEGVPRLPFVTRGASGFDDAARVDPAANGVFCLTCHKAHGSGFAFGLNWPQEGAAARTGCDQCHSVDGPTDSGDPSPAAALAPASQ